MPAVDLVPLAAGAVLAHPFMLYPLWAAFGPGSTLRRLATTLILALAVFGAATVRGRARGHHEPLALGTASTVVLFSLMTFAVWPIRWLGKWQLSTCGTSSTGASARLSPVQFRLQHLFECMTLAAAILALCRFYFPDGIPAELFAGWRQQFTRMLQGIPFLMVGLLPAALVAGFILSFQKNGRTSMLCATATLVFWIVLDCWLVWRTGVLTPYAWLEIVSPQLGAAASGITSATVLRACGYHLARVVTRPKPLTT